MSKKTAIEVAMFCVLSIVNYFAWLPEEAGWVFSMLTLASLVGFLCVVVVYFGEMEHRIRISPDEFEQVRPGYFAGVGRDVKRF